MTQERITVDAEESGPLDALRRFFALQRDVLVLSLAMFAFSLGFQMTSRFLPEYMVALGASGGRTDRTRVAFGSHPGRSPRGDGFESF